MRTFTIIDELDSDNRAEHVPADGIADAISDWFWGAWVEVQPIIDDLQAKVLADEYYGDEAAFLGIRIEPEH